LNRARDAANSRQSITTANTTAEIRLTANPNKIRAFLVIFKPSGRQRLFNNVQD
jgi:hypothetical protein